jgi:hemerythrin-like domain-containing protein
MKVDASIEGDTLMPAQDAISLLEEDHKRVKKLLAALEETTERATKTRGELLEDIAMELKAHTTIEEEIFYPAYKAAVDQKDDRKLYYEAVEEHHVVDLVLPELQKTDVTSEEFGAKAKVLKELVEHHIEEEEDEMFPRARKAITKAELTELAGQMQQRKTELLPVAK